MEDGSLVLADMVASPDADPRDLLPQQVAALRSHFATSLYDFAWAVCGMTKIVPEVHGPVCELFQQWGTDDYRRLMVQLPRGSYKSSIVTISGGLWLLANDPDRTIAIFNETLDNAKRFLGSIESIVRRSRVFQVLYRDLLPPGIAIDDPRSTPKSWPFNSERLLFERERINEPEVSATAFGVGAASAGHHWSHLLFDDLISKEAADSQTVMQHAKDWVDTSIYLGPSPELLNVFCSCTRWHYDDVYEYMRRKHSFRLYRRGALEDGASIAPTIWSTDTLHRMQETDPHNFAGQMQNEPRAGRDQSFKPEWRRRCLLVNLGDEEQVSISREHYDPKVAIQTNEELALGDRPPPRVPLSSLTKVVLVDPAPHTETDRRREPNARTALVVKGVDAWGRRYLLDLWAGREEPVELCRRIARMAIRWGTTRVAIEEVVFSKVYAPFLRYVSEREREFKGWRLHYLPLTPGRRDKDTRIQSLIPSYEAGFEYQVAQVAGLHAEEYLTYPYSSTRDILDAEAYGGDPGILPIPRTPFAEEAAELMDTGGKLDDTRDEITGY